MKLGTVLICVLLAVILAAAGGEYWLLQRTQEEAKRFVARLLPYGQLRYSRVWAWPWGAGEAAELSFKPEGMASLVLLTPPGFQVTAKKLEIHHLGLDDHGAVQHVEGTLFGVEVPVSEVHAPPPDSPQPADNPLPTLYDLGYSRLAFDLDFAVSFVPETPLTIVQLNAVSPDTAKVYLKAQLEGTPDQYLRAPDVILIRKLALEVQDLGVIAKLKDVAAGRSKVGRDAWEQAVIEKLDRRAADEHWRWDESTAQLLRLAIRDSDYVRIGLDPPSDVALRNIRLYKVGDWPVLLGFTMDNRGRFDHPAPGGALP